MTHEPIEQREGLTRPIIGIENRTAQEVFDIMCDRIVRRLAAEQTRASTPAVDREAVARVNDPQGVLVPAEPVCRIIEAMEIAPIIKQRLILEIGGLRTKGTEA